MKKEKEITIPFLIHFKSIPLWSEYNLSSRLEIQKQLPATFNEEQK